LSKIDGVFLAHRFTDTTFLFFKIKTGFIDIGDQGYGLSEVDMDGFILRYFLIKSIRDFDGAIFDAGGTTRASALYDISGLFNQCYPEISPFPLYTVNFSIAQDLDVGMPADLDQFRREYSNGALIGGEGLVKLGHLAANGGGLINQVNFKARIAKVECGLNTTDTPADNHHIPKITACESITDAARKTFTNLVFNYFERFFHFPSPH
jgi:hypothetical protein